MNGSYHGSSCHRADREQPEYSHYMLSLFPVWFIYIYQQQWLLGDAVLPKTGSAARSSKTQKHMFSKKVNSEFLFHN